MSQQKKMNTMSSDVFDDVVQEMTAFYEWSIACCGYPLGLEDLQMLASCLLAQREVSSPSELVDRLVATAVCSSDFMRLRDALSRVGTKTEEEAAHCLLH